MSEDLAWVFAEAAGWLGDRFGPGRRQRPPASPPSTPELPARLPDFAGRLARPEEVATALILAEVLGLPRARQPYRPGRWLWGGPPDRGP